MKHTPGPWTNDGDLIDTSDGVIECDTGPASEANARLIAAAPDLLAVIQSLPPIDAPDFRERYVALLNGPARSAIAKAQA